MSKPKEITIEVFERTDGDYEYNIYRGSPVDIAEDTHELLDGGVCTSDLHAAINIASTHARDLLEDWREIPEQELNDLRTHKTTPDKNITR